MKDVKWFDLWSNCLLLPLTKRGEAYDSSDACHNDVLLLLAKHSDCASAKRSRSLSQIIKFFHSSVCFDKCWVELICLTILFVWNEDVGLLTRPYDEIHYKVQD